MQFHFHFPILVLGFEVPARIRSGRQNFQQSKRNQFQTLKSSAACAVFLPQCTNPRRHSDQLKVYMQLKEKTNLFTKNMKHP